MGTIIDKLNYLRQTKETLKQSLDAQNVSYTDDTTFRQLCELVKSIKSYSSPFKALDYGAGTQKSYNDELGTYYVSKLSQFSENKYHYSWTRVLNEEFDTSNGIDVAVGLKRLCNLRYGNPTGSIWCDATPVVCNPYRFLLPDKMAYANGLVWVTETSAFRDGLYIGKSCSYMISTWINGDILLGDDVERKTVKCAEGCDISALYLQNIKITKESLVSIFENLCNVPSGESFTIYIGEINISILTEEDLDVAREKGWSIA